VSRLLFFSCSLQENRGIARIGAPAAVVSAVLDALAPLGVTDLDMPLTSEQLWRRIRNARSEAESS
jgi:hypothetical protein